MSTIITDYEKKDITVPVAEPTHVIVTDGTSDDANIGYHELGNLFLRTFSVRSIEVPPYILTLDVNGAGYSTIQEIKPLLLECIEFDDLANEGDYLATINGADVFYNKSSNILGIKNYVYGVARGQLIGSDGYRADFVDQNGSPINWTVTGFPHNEDYSDRDDFLDSTSVLLASSGLDEIFGHNAFTTTCYAFPNNSAIIASTASKTHSGFTSIIASKGSFADAGTSAVLSSIRGHARAVSSTVIGSNECGVEPMAHHSTVISSRLTSTVDEHTLVMGWMLDNPDGGTTAGRKIQLSGFTGDVHITGSLSTGAFDFAEFFVNGENKEIGAGHILTNKCGKVFIANEGDTVDGVVSCTAAIIGNRDSFYWHKRFIRNEFGQLVYEEVTDPDWSETIPNPNYNGSNDRFISNPEPRKTIMVPKENPEWDITREQIDRSKRPDEWTIVGLLGQVYTRVSKDVKENQSVQSGNNGIGIPSNTKTGLRAMKITTPYSEEKGYAVALCLINIQP